jgi:hypothetical protein
MQFDMKAWLGQSTTGQGIGGMLGILAAVSSGQMTWQAAIPLLVGAVILIIWPQNKSLAQSAQTVASDVEVLIPQLLAAYRTGLQHGAAAVPSPAPAPPAAAPVIAAPVVQPQQQG